MSYGLKYKVELTNKKDKLVVIELHEKGYSGAWSYLDAGATVPELRPDISDHYRGLSLFFSVEATTDEGLPEFFVEEARKFKVVLKHDGVIEFVGFLVPEIYEDPYIAAPFDVQLTATDGLGLLKNIDFDLTGYHSDLACIDHILKKTGHGLPVAVAVDVQYLGQTTMTFPAMTYARTNTAKFYDSKGKVDNCYEALKKILASYGLELYVTQWRNRWLVFRTIDMLGEFFTFTNAAYVSRGTLLSPADFGKGQALDAVGSLNRSLNKRLHKVHISNKLGRKESVLPLDVFEQEIVRTLNRSSHSRRGGVRHLYNAKNWTWVGNAANDTTQWRWEYLTGAMTFVVFPAYTGSNLANYVYYQSMPLGASSEKWVAAFDLAMERGVGNGGKVSIPVDIQHIATNGTIRYLTENGWESSPDPLLIEMENQTVFRGFQTPYPSGQYRILLPSVPADGMVRFRLFRPGNHSTQPYAFTIRNLTLFEDLSTSPVPEYVNYDVNISENVINSEEIEVEGSSPEYPNAHLLFANVKLAPSLTSAPFDWIHKGDTTRVYPLAVVQMREIASNNRVPRQMLSGRMDGAAGSLVVVRDKTVPDQPLFWFQDGVWDLWSDEMDGTFYQLLPYEEQDLTISQMLVTENFSSKNENSVNASQASAQTSVATGTRGSASSSTSWVSITGKPDTFPPAPHTHAIAQVTGLQAALDAKAKKAGDITQDFHVKDLHIAGQVNQWLAQQLVVDDARIQVNRRQGGATVDSGLVIYNKDTSSEVSSLVYDVDGIWRAGGSRLFTDAYNPTLGGVPAADYALKSWVENSATAYNAARLGGYSAASYPRKAENAEIPGNWIFGGMGQGAPDDSIINVRYGYSSEVKGRSASIVMGRGTDIYGTERFQIGVFADNAWGDAPHFHIKQGTGVGLYESRLAILRTSGFVGIGATNPTERLHVAGNGLFTGNLSAVNAALSGTLAVTGATTFGGNVGTANFASQTQGWRVTPAGVADFRHIYTDELQAKAFTADISQALVGSDVLTKSVAKLAQNWTTTANGATSTIYVEELEGFPGLLVFAVGDRLLLRLFDRSNGGLLIKNIWATVASYVSTTNNVQRYTITVNSGGATGHTVYAGSMILDYGTSGSGVIERTVLDAMGSPYSQVKTWVNDPSNPANYTIHNRTGNLDGIANASGFGFYGENTFLTKKLLVGDLTKAGQYMEYENGQLNIKGQITVTGGNAATKEDVDAVQVGGRNLIIRKTEVADTWIDPSGNIATQANHATSDYIPLTAGSYMFSREASVLVSEPYFRWAWYDSDNIYIARQANSATSFSWIPPSGAAFVRISYPTDCSPQFERGNRATDWTPAPEDVDAKIADTKLYVEYSTDGTSWHTTFQANDIYMRQKTGVNGTWTGAIKIVGKDGTSVSIKGKVPTSASLPSSAGLGDGYIAEDTGHLWVWTGSWTDAGQIQGDNGANSYIHIAYADDSQGGGFSHNPSGKSWIGTYADFTAIDSDTPSDYTWMYAKGQQGEPGVSVSEVDVEFAQSTSATTAPTTGWQTTAPAWESGKYIWHRTKTTYSTGDPTYSAAVNLTGAKGSTGSTGAAGTGVSSITEQYYLSTSKTTQTGGSWVESPPAWEAGKYMWTRVQIVYKNPTSTDYTDPILSAEWDAIDTLKNRVENTLGLADLEGINKTLITNGKVRTALLEATEIAALVVTAKRVEGLTLNFDKGAIGGWSMGAASIASENAFVRLHKTSGIVVSNTATTDNVFANNNRVNMYYFSPTDWGLSGRVGGDIIFQLGSTNKIAGINFDDSKLSTPNWELNKDGSFSFAGGKISGTAAGSMSISNELIANALVGNILKSSNWTGAGSEVGVQFNLNQGKLEFGQSIDIDSTNGYINVKDGVSGITGAMIGDFPLSNLSSGGANIDVTTSGSVVKNSSGTEQSYNTFVSITSAGAISSSSPNLSSAFVVGNQYTISVSFSCQFERSSLSSTLPSSNLGPSRSYYYFEGMGLILELLDSNGNVVSSSTQTVNVLYESIPTITVSLNRKVTAPTTIMMVRLRLVGNSRYVQRITTYDDYGNPTSAVQETYQTRCTVRPTGRLIVKPASSITELSSKGFQSLWGPEKYFRISDKAGEPAFIQSSGSWIHKGHIRGNVIPKRDYKDISADYTITSNDMLNYSVYQFKNTSGATRYISLPTEATMTSAFGSAMNATGMTMIIINDRYSTSHIRPRYYRDWNGGYASSGEIQMGKGNVLMFIWLGDHWQITSRSV